ncbi:hypothetical protein GcC1_020002 [Golovinomyces cichoracearum]|uniref:Acyltransferase 3 domain-containing protein n=1 Tax=Golovinomyces cichoracearum TaxID=62708 RepID=A0A420J543_9PEZI|nr:hypothetical protein GcC1_020002 [Golovinomyces cichoracearum]
MAGYKQESDQEMAEISPDAHRLLSSPSVSTQLIQDHQTQIIRPILRALKWFGDLIRPSIFTSSTRRKLGPTAYLDGLRGWAAFMVYWQHHQIWARVGISAEHIFENAWGWDGRHYFCAFPFVRSLFTGGHCAVAVFFVISGRVLTAKPLSLLHAGENLKFGDSLSSALFRRWLRLYIPCICTSFLYMTSWHLFGIWTAYPKHEATWLDELWNWYNELKGFSFVFRSTGPTAPPWLTYNFHLWSIPVEFRGSILVYTSMFAFSKCTRYAKIYLCFILIFYFLYIADSPHYAMFTVGMLYSDLDLLENSHNLPKFFYQLREFFGEFQTLVWSFFFCIGMYLSGVPSLHNDMDSLRKSPGWYYLSHLAPQGTHDFKWFFLFWASTIIVGTLPRLSWLKGFFENRFCQYLGRNSFALYLVHGPVLWTLSDRVYLAAGWTRTENVDGLKSWMNIYPISSAGPLGLELRFIIPHLIILPITLWLAEITTKLFDEPSVRISHWAYQKTLPSRDV